MTSLPKPRVLLLSILTIIIMLHCQATDPVDDRCETAIPIIIGRPVGILATTIDQGIGSPLYFNTCGDGQVFDVTTPGVWIQLTGTGARLRASTCNSATEDFEHRITIFGGNPECQDRICVTSSSSSTEDGDCTCLYCNNNSTVSVEWDTLPNTMYYIFVHDKFMGESGRFALQVTDIEPPPENDVYENATLLQADVSTPGTTVGATYDWDANELECVSNECFVDNSPAPPYPGVWYSIPSVDFNSTMTVVVCSVFLRMDVAIFYNDNDNDAMCGNDLSCPSSVVGVYNETCAVTGLASKFEWTAMAGQEFYLYVFAYNAYLNDNHLKIGSFQILYSQQELVTTDPTDDDDTDSPSKAPTSPASVEEREAKDEEGVDAIFRGLIGAAAGIGAFLVFLAFFYVGCKCCFNNNDKKTTNNSTGEKELEQDPTHPPITP